MISLARFQSNLELHAPALFHSTASYGGHSNGKSCYQFSNTGIIGQQLHFK